MKKAFNFLFILFFVTSSIFALEISIPDSVPQGGVITVFVDDGEKLPGSKVRLGNGDEIYSETEVFHTVIGENPVDIAILGAPPELSPGEYTISVLSSGGITENRRINVAKSEFISEDIPLSRTMSDLRQSDDMEKAEQWRNLLAILKTVDIEDIYDTGNLKIPLTDYIRKSSFYGDRRRFLYDDGSSARSIHNGIDYSAVTGTPVYAAGAGRIVFSGERIISGFTVVIEHLPGVYTLYYHMDSLDVEEGDMVAAGSLIGTVGATGLATGSHLHWEVRVAGVAVDPGTLMSVGIIDKAFILSNIKEQ